MSESFDAALGAGYRLVRTIGAGASGQVWLAEDTRTGDAVAAKLLRPEHAGDHEIVSRFVAERTVLTSLRHPGIVAVRDLVVEGDRVAIVMDYVPGGTLRELLTRERCLPPATAVALTVLVLDALAYAHQQGVLHRDVKPDNVLLADTWQSVGDGDVKLTDFGIARLVESESRMTTGLLGTPEYMPPELVDGDAGFPADVYAAGVLLYELLAGRTPFAGGDPFVIVQRHREKQPPPLSVPDALWEQLSELLDKDPTRRPTAAMGAAGLRRLAGTLTGLPGLEPAAAPEIYDGQERPSTVLRGMPAPDSSGSAALDQGPAEPVPDLGDSGGHATLYRPAKPPVTATPARTADPTPKPVRPAWKNPKVLIGAGLTIALIGAVAGVYVAGQSGTASAPPSTGTAASVTVTVTQQDRPTPTGLTIARSASWDRATQQVTVTITYTAQNAPLTGPFLEILPGPAHTDSCPSVTWDTGNPARNLPSNTGITATCGWAVDPATIPAQGTQTVTATLALELTGNDPQPALQRWLTAAAQATTTAVMDDTITSTAYPVQRLQNIQVTTPSSVVTQTALPVTLIPVWPSGPDTLNPLLTTTTVGAPSTMLHAVAGGTSGVRISDQCAGALAISANGLSVTTLTQTPSCIIGAQVGNFINLSTAPFAIVTRGG